MYVRNETSSRTELVKWILLLFLAAALALAFASIASGGDVKKAVKPSLTPPTLNDPVRQQAPSQDPRSEDDLFDASMKVWQAIDALQEKQSPEKALAAWSIELPAESAAWRCVAIGVSHLRAEEIEDASQALHTARRYEPDNPVVHYYMGILRLRQSAQAMEWEDAVNPSQNHLAAHDPERIAPNSKSMYQLAALMEFHGAVENAARVRFDQPLLPAEWAAPGQDGMTMPIMSPTVMDLLIALEIDNFKGQAHYILGHLHMKRGELDHAEDHLDQAAGLGIAGSGYRELSEQYAAEHRHADAVRTNLKWMAREEDAILPAKKAWKNLLEALLE